MAIYNFNEQKKKSKNTDYQKIIGIICVAISFLALFSLITNFIPFVKSFLLGIIGLFGYPFFITLMAIGFALIAHKKYVMPKKYIVLLTFSIIFVLSVFQLILVKNTNITFWQYIGKCYTQKTTAGGIILGFVTAPILYLLNRLGAYIIFIALSLIFIALTVDYIHYLGKNKDLKKSIKISNSSKTTNSKITVSELENTIKQNASILFEEEKIIEEPKEKVKITLDAKIENETQEESARRKLGLLASSNTENSYENESLKEEPHKTVSNFSGTTREYLLSGYSESELHNFTTGKINKIQENFNEIKKSQYNVTSLPVKNNKILDLSEELILPNKVIHDNSTNNFSYNTNKVESKSVIGELNLEEISQKPQNEYEDNALIQNSKKSIGYSVTDLNNDFEISPFKQEMKENQKIDIPQEKTIDVEDFTNNILASLNLEEKSYNETKVEYTSPKNEFKEEQRLIEPIIPKKDITYVKPPIELLTTESMDLSLMNDDVVMKREELEMALDTFGIPAKVIGVVIGPAVTRYELEMPAGISIKKLISLQEDIAYYLSSNGDIRIEAPIPGRRAVGIEVPNEKVATVGIKDIILSREFMESKSMLNIALGKDIAGTIKTFSLVKIPHLLVAGTTGSGKSVCINSIILSLIYRYSPEEVKLILIDPKRVEFSMYNNLPHLIMPQVITDTEKALNALAWCVNEMERRFILFSNARVKTLEEYNESPEVLEGRAEKVPYIIFVIDELAELLMTAKKEAEDYICRLLQLARASGIHMILATQRPSVNVVTGKIKANLPARICFSLMTTADSKTVLDQGGAEKLLGKGDMLFISTDTAVPKRIQGCFVTTKEIDDVVKFIKENNKEYDFDIKTEQAIINPPKNDVVTQLDGDRASSDGFDSLMPQVLKAVIETGHASISMIQRKFLVGFPRAARIIDQMETAGYISPSDGSKSRSVYITMEEYDKLYGEEG